MPLKGKGVYGKGVDYPSGGVVAGVGMIHGRLCVILANDATVKVGGTITSCSSDVLASYCYPLSLTLVFMI